MRYGCQAWSVWHFDWMMTAHLRQGRRPAPRIGVQLQPHPIDSCSIHHLDISKGMHERLLITMNILLSYSIWPMVFFRECSWFCRPRGLLPVVARQPLIASPKSSALTSRYIHRRSLMLHSTSAQWAKFSSRCFKRCLHSRRSCHYQNPQSPILFTLRALGPFTSLTNSDTTLHA